MILTADVPEHRRILDQLKRSKDASYRSEYVEEKAQLHPGTRDRIRREILEWARNPQQESRLQIMYGPAGAGKSAIARAVSEELANDCLGASVFFQRAVTDCNDPHLVFPTIAYQLAHYRPELLPYIVPAVEQYLPHGDIQGITYQAQALFFDILARIPETDDPLVLVIDGIDECSNSKEGVVPKMLDILCQAAARFRFLRIFIATRPETHITRALPKTGDAAAVMRDLWEDSAGEVTEDIETFIRSKFDECARGGGFLLLQERPDCVAQLAHLANGIFVYAATVARFLVDDERLAVDIFDDLLASHRSTAIIGLHAPIDELYTTILQTAFGKLRVNHDRMAHIRHILAWFVLVDHSWGDPGDILNAESFALVGIPTTITMDVIDRLRSVLIVKGDITRSTDLKPYHLSFREFLGDSARRSWWLTAWLWVT